MLFTKRTKLELPTPDQALPGRGDPVPVPSRHEVLGTPLVPPFPDGIEPAVFGMGCFWGAERKFWQAPGVYTTAVGYAGGLHAEPDLRGGLLAAGPGTPRSCSSSSTRRRRATRRCCASSGRTTTRRRACARATTSARSTARRSTPRRRRRSARPPRRRATRTRRRSPRPATARSRPRSPTRRPVLLRGGLPPAVPREEPGGYCGLGGTGVSCPVGVARAEA